MVGKLNSIVNTFQFDNKLKFMSADQIAEIEILTMQNIQSQIMIGAGCNQVGDHSVLGELTLDFQLK
jgi:hypothetical protein